MYSIDLAVQVYSVYTLPVGTAVFLSFQQKGVEIWLLQGPIHQRDGPQVLVHNCRL